MARWDAGGHWVTLEDGQHVLINNSYGTIMAGLGPQNNGKTFAQLNGLSASESKKGINSDRSNMRDGVYDVDLELRNTAQSINAIPTSTTKKTDHIEIAKQLQNISDTHFEKLYGSQQVNNNALAETAASKYLNTINDPEQLRIHGKKELDNMLRSAISSYVMEVRTFKDAFDLD